MTADELVAEIDRKFGAHRWTVYRCRNGQWVARINFDAEAIFGRDTLKESLAALAAYSPLPDAPPKPRLLARENFYSLPVAGTQLVQLRYLGDEGARALVTADEVGTVADWLVTQSEVALAEWQRTYGDQT